jgi:glutaminyl-tRNA synthetase
VLYIERADFKEDADKNFFRLTIDREVRLKYAYIIKCTHVVKDAEGNITEIHCTYDPETKSGMPTTRKVKATIHWISETFAQPAEIRLFERLFTVPEPDNTDEGKTFLDYINPNSLTVTNGLIEKNITKENAAKYYQFERTGYFCVDKDATDEQLVFNKTVGLKQ